MPMMNQNQPGYSYGYGYGYGYADRSSWEDNYPAEISNKQWREHVKTTQNAYNSAQDNATKIGEVKNAIRETHASVNSTQAHVKDTQDAIGLAHASIQGTHLAVKDAYLAIQQTQDVINNRHAEQMSKQEECAAGVAKLCKYVEEKSKKREETRRLQDMVQYAQSQGLLQTHAQAQAQALAQIRLDQDRDHRGRSSRSLSPATSASSSGACDHGRRTCAIEEWEADRRQRRERERERQLQEQQQRLSREIEHLRRRDAHFHQPRLRDSYYEDYSEAPLYNNAYAYAEYDIGGSGGAGHRGARGACRMQPRCGNGRVRDY